MGIELIKKQSAINLTSSNANVEVKAPATETIKEAYEAGKSSVIDESKIITKTVSSKGLLNIADVSEIPHTIKLKLTSDTITDFSNTKVTVCGKNLCPVNSGVVGKFPNPVWQGDLNGAFSFSYIHSLEDVEITGAASFAIYTDVKTIYSGLNNAYFYTAQGNLTKIQFINWCGAKSGSINNIQLEVGYSATKYEPYAATEYTANADGTLEIQSGNTVMNIITDKNINIEATYNVSWGAENVTNDFWDSLQDKGNRTDYSFAFNGITWNNNTFKPKYDIKPLKAERMFYWSKLQGDLVEICDKLGIVIDFSQATNMYEVFHDYAWGDLALTRIGIIDFSSTTSATYAFRYNKKLVTIDKLVFHSGIKAFTGAFEQCYALENITIEGEIANSISFSHSSKLTHDSLMSVINALATVETTKTLTLHADSKAKLTDAEKAIATNKGWTIA
jgi:hypothetical protein